MALFVVAHGAWSAGWAWKKMHPLMAVRGHRLVTPTYTGSASGGISRIPDIDLETHIADMLAVLEFEDLRDVILIGHSYGGMVATGVADRARERVATLVYLDAFAPRDGESAFDILPQATRDQRRAGVGEGWSIPPGPMPPDTPDADKEWAAPKPASAAAEDIRAEAAIQERRADIAAALHLLRAPRAGRSLPAVLRARQGRRLGRL